MQILVDLRSPRQARFCKFPVCKNPAFEFFTSSLMESV